MFGPRYLPESPGGGTLASFLRKITQAAHAGGIGRTTTARAVRSSASSSIEKLDLRLLPECRDIVNYDGTRSRPVFGAAPRQTAPEVTPREPRSTDRGSALRAVSLRDAASGPTSPRPHGGDRREQSSTRHQKYGKTAARLRRARCRDDRNGLTYRGRSAEREVGKVLSIRAGKVDGSRR